MFRVKTLFSTVSISNRKYCLNICTLPGNWAMLENKAAYLITFFWRGLPPPGFARRPRPAANIEGRVGNLEAAGDKG